MKKKKTISSLAEMVSLEYQNFKNSETQVGGDHYKCMAIQPAEFCTKNNIGYLEGAVIKYICRYKKKNGKQDLEKAIHCIQLLIEYNYEKI